MNFEYKNYLLRKPKIDDAKGFVAISSDPEVMKYYGDGSGNCKNLDEGKKQVEWAHKEFEKNAGRFIITQKDNDNYIGDIGFHGFIKTHNRAELGYRLMAKYWRQGIVSNFIGQLLIWAFETLNYNRIESVVDVRNDGSKHVLLKNKFQWGQAGIWF